MPRSELLAFGAGAVLIFAMFALPWFELTPDGVVVQGSSGNAFEWMGEVDIVLVVVGVFALGLPAAHLWGLFPRTRPGDGLLLFAGGLIALALIGDRLISPPGLAGDAFGHFGGGGEASARYGAWVGLLAAAGIAAAGIGRLLAPAAGQFGAEPATSPEKRFESITAAELEGLGLTPTQARRIVRYRDELGLVKGLADLGQVPGIPQRRREELRQRLAQPSA